MYEQLQRAMSVLKNMFFARFIQFLENLKNLMKCYFIMLHHKIKI